MVLQRLVKACGIQRPYHSRQTHEFEEKISELNLELRSALAQKAQLVETVVSLEAERNELLKKSGAPGDDMKGRAESLGAKLVETQAELERLRVATTDAIAKAQAETRELRSVLDQSWQGARELESELMTTLAERDRELELLRATSEGALVDLQAESDKLRTRVQTLTAELEDAGARSSAERRDFEAEKSALSSKIVDRERELESLKIEAHSTNEDMLRDFDALEAESVELKNQCEHLTAELEDAKSRSSADRRGFEAKKSAFSSQIGDREFDFETLKAGAQTRTEELQKDYNAPKDELSRPKRDLRNAQQPLPLPQLVGTAPSRATERSELVTKSGQLVGENVAREESLDTKLEEREAELERLRASHADVIAKDDAQPRELRSTLDQSWQGAQGLESELRTALAEQDRKLELTRVTSERVTVDLKEESDEPRPRVQTLIAELEDAVERSSAERRALEVYSVVNSKVVDGESELECSQSETKTAREDPQGHDDALEPESVGLKGGLDNAQEQASLAQLVGTAASVGAQRSELMKTSGERRDENKTGEESLDKRLVETEAELELLRASTADVTAKADAETRELRSTLDQSWEGARGLESELTSTLAERDRELELLRASSERAIADLRAESDELRARVRTLTAELEDAVERSSADRRDFEVKSVVSSKLVEQEAELESLGSETHPTCEDVHSDNDALEAESVELRNRCESLIAELECARSPPSTDRREFDVDRSTLSSPAIDREFEVEALKTESQATAEALHEHHTGKDEVSSQKLDLNTAPAQASLARLMGTTVSLETGRNELLKKSAGLGDDIKASEESVGKKLVEPVAEMERLRTSITSAVSTTEAIAEAHAETQELRSALDQSWQGMQGLGSDLTTIPVERDRELELLHATWLKTIEDLKAESDELRARVQTLTAELEDAGERSSAERRGFEEEKSALSSMIVERECELENVKTEAQRTREDLQRDFDAVEAESVELRNRCEHLTAELENTGERSLAERRDFEAEKSALSSRIVEREGELENVKTEALRTNQNLKRDFDALEAESVELRNQCEHLAAELKDAKSRSSEDRGDFESEKSALGSKIVDREFELETLKTEARTRTEDVQKDYNAVKDELSGLKLELDTAREQRSLDQLVGTAVSQATERGELMKKSGLLGAENRTTEESLGAKLVETEAELERLRASTTDAITKADAETRKLRLALDQSRQGARGLESELRTTLAERDRELELLRATSQRAIVDLKEESDELRIQVRTLTVKLEDAGELSSAARRDFAAEKSALSSKIVERECELDNVKTVAQRAREDLQRDYDALEAESVERRNRLEHLTAELEGASERSAAERTDFEAEKSVLCSRIIEREAELANVKTEAQTTREILQREYDALEAESVELVNRCQHLTAELEHASDRSSAERRDFEEEKSILSSRIAERERELESLKTEVQTTREVLQRDHDTLEAESVELRIQCEHLTAELQDVKIRSSADRRDFEAEKSALSSRIADREFDLETLKTESQTRTEELHKDYNAVKDELARLERDLDTARKHASIAQDEIARLQFELLSARELASLAQDELEAERSRLTEAEAELIIAKGRSLEDTEKARSEYEKLEQRLRDLQAQLQAALRMVEATREHEEQRRALEARLRSTLGEHEMREEASRQKLGEATAAANCQIATLRAQHAEKDETLAQLSAQLAYLKQTAASHASQLEAAQRAKAKLAESDTRNEILRKNILAIERSKAELEDSFKAQSADLQKLKGTEASHGEKVAEQAVQLQELEAAKSELEQSLRRAKQAKLKVREQVLNRDEAMAEQRRTIEELAGSLEGAQKTIQELRQSHSDNKALLDDRSCRVGAYEKQLHQHGRSDLMNGVAFDSTGLGRDNHQHLVTAAPRELGEQQDKIETDMPRENEALWNQHRVAVMEAEHVRERPRTASEALKRGQGELESCVRILEEKLTESKSAVDALSAEKAVAEEQVIELRKRLEDLGAQTAETTPLGKGGRGKLDNPLLMILPTIGAVILGGLVLRSN